MIISASRRTDIPAFYSQWFLNRLEKGFVCVRNPMNPRRVSRVSLSADVLDGIVFWTKNPVPMMDKLVAISHIPYYFQFTLNAYGKDIETDLPNKNDVLVPAFQALSRKLGPNRVIWRYDPILLTDAYTPEYHVHSFEKLAKRLCGYTHTCVISFIDLYRNTESALRGTGFVPFTQEAIISLAARFQDIARKYGISLQTCSEAVSLSHLGIEHGKCIDKALLETLCGSPLRAGKDKNQRKECLCMESIDIGAYDSCPNGCKYCYATHSIKTLQKNLSLNDPSSPLLIGHIGPDDIVTNRAVYSLKDNQLSLF